MEKTKVKNLKNLLLGMFFCYIMLFCGAFVSVGAQELLPNIKLTIDGVNINKLDNGVYYAKNDITVELTGEGQIEYQIIKNNQPDSWVVFTQPFTLQAEEGKVNNYTINYAFVVDDVRGEEGQAVVLLDNQKPMLEVVLKSGGQHIDGVYTGQFLTYKLQQSDYNGIGFENGHNKLNVLYKTRDIMGSVITDWSDMEYDEGSDTYTVMLDNPDIKRVEFKSIDWAGNYERIRITVNIPAGKPVISDVQVLPDKWINASLFSTKDIVITVEESEVPITHLLITDENETIVCNWEEVTDFSNNEVLYKLPQGKYNIRLKNESGLISDKYENVIVDGFDSVPPKLEIIKVEHDINNSVQPGRLYFEFALMLGEDGAPLDRFMYKQVGSQEHYEVLLSTPLQLGGNIIISENITSGEWEFKVRAQSGLVSETVSQKMLEKTEIEQQWKQLTSNLNIFNITIEDKEAIDLAINFVDNWVESGNDIEEIKSIELENWGTNGVQLLAILNELFLLKESGLIEISSAIETVKGEPLTETSLDKLTNILSSAVHAINNIQIEEDDLQVVIENFTEIKNQLTSQINTYTISALEEIDNVPKGVRIFFCAVGSVGAPRSIVADEGSDVYLLDYRPVHLGKIFLYWQEKVENGVRPENDTIIAGEKENITCYIAIWYDLNIVASVRSGQTLEHLKNQLPTGVNWIDDSISVVQAGWYEVDVTVTDENGTYIRKAPFVVKPVITENFLTTQRLKEVALPEGWEWEDGTEYLKDGKATYTTIFTIEKDLKTVNMKYELEIQANTVKVDNEKPSGALTIIINIIAVFLTASGALIIIKTRRKQNQEKPTNKTDGV